MAQIEKCVLLIDHLSNFSKAHKLIKAISIFCFILFGNTISVAQQLWRIQMANKGQNGIIFLKQKTTNKPYYYSTYNTTIGDYEIFKTIPFDRLVANPKDTNATKAVMLRYGAGWIVNINKATKDQISAFFTAVNSEVGIFRPGYMRQYASINTYKSLNNYLKRNNSSITDTVYPIKTTQTCASYSDLQNQLQKEYDDLVKEIAELKRQDRLYKKSNSNKTSSKDTLIAQQAKVINSQEILINSLIRYYAKQRLEPKGLSDRTITIINTALTLIGIIIAFFACKAAFIAIKLTKRGLEIAERGLEIAEQQLNIALAAFSAQQKNKEDISQPLAKPENDLFTGRNSIKDRRNSYTDNLEDFAAFVDDKGNLVNKQETHSGSQDVNSDNDRRFTNKTTLNNKLSFRVIEKETKLRKVYKDENGKYSFTRQ